MKEENPNVRHRASSIAVIVDIGYGYLIWWWSWIDLPTYHFHAQIRCRIDNQISGCWTWLHARWDEEIEEVDDIREVWKRSSADDGQKSLFFGPFRADTVVLLSQQSPCSSEKYQQQQHIAIQISPAVTFTGNHCIIPLYIPSSWTQHPWNIYSIAPTHPKDNDRERYINNFECIRHFTRIHQVCAS